MPQIPQYVRQTPPQSRGPQLTGLAQRANAGIGAAVAQFGSRLAGWADQKLDVRRAQEEREAERAAIVAAGAKHRDLDDRRLRYMLDLRNPQRRQELSAVAVDPVTGAERSGYDVELDRFGDWMQGQFDELSEGLSPRAREVFQAEYDGKYGAWAGQFAQAMDGLEIEDVTARTRDLARSGRAAEALTELDLYRDRLGPERHQKLSVELAITGAQKDLQAQAELGGWESARALLQDPAWQETYGLDVAEAAGVRNALAGFVNDEAQRSARQTAVEQELLARRRIDEAYEGTVDLDAVRAEYLSGSLPAEAYESVRRLTVEGRRLQNDPAAYAAYVDLKDAVARGARPAAELKAFAVANAGLLTAATFQEALDTAGNPFSMQVQAKNDAVQRAYGQFVRISEDSLAELLRSGVSGEEMKTAADERAQQLNLVNIVSDELEEWIRKNPDATRAEVLRRGREVQVLIAGQAVEEQDRLIGAWQRGESIGFAGGSRKREGTSLTPLTPLTTPTAPSGLEGVWGRLDGETQAAALRLLARGVTAAEILQELQRKGIE